MPGRCCFFCSSVPKVMTEGPRKPMAMAMGVVGALW